MSRALQACILIVLDARRGAEVPVASLATLMLVEPEVVRRELETLEQLGQVQTARLSPDWLIDGAMIVHNEAGACA
jgi:folylpolyglutamate synthase/dihydropteroate synthase